MLVALLVALLVGLPSIVTAHTLDHQQLDISGALGTNPASIGDFGGKHLSKYPTHPVEDPPKPHEIRNPSQITLKNVTSQEHGLFDNTNELDTYHPKSVRPVQEKKSPNRPKKFENKSEKILPCPEPSDIVPCVCTTTDTNDLVLDCSNIVSVDQLAEVFLQDFPFTSFYELRIFANDNLQYLADIFNGVTFRYINFRNVKNLSKITKYAFFDSRDTLERIYIYNSALTENSFPFSTLDEFPMLIDFEIEVGNINIWPAFDSPSLKIISFYSNRISELPVGEDNNRIRLSDK